MKEMNMEETFKKMKRVTKKQSSTSASITKRKSAIVEETVEDMFDELTPEQAKKQAYEKLKVTIFRKNAEHTVHNDARIERKNNSVKELAESTAIIVIIQSTEEITGASFSKDEAKAYYDKLHYVLFEQKELNGDKMATKKDNIVKEMFNELYDRKLLMDKVKTTTDKKTKNKERVLD